MEIYQINTTQDGNISHAARARGVSLQKSCMLKKNTHFLNTKNVLHLFELIHPSKKGAAYTFYSTPRPKAEYPPQHNGFSTFVKMLRCETTDLDITINIKSPIIYVY